MTQPDTSARDAAVLAAYQQQVAAVRQRLATYIESLWVSLGSWRRADMPKFTRAAIPVVEAAMRQVGSLTQAQLASMGPRAFAKPVSVPSLGVTDVRSGVTADEVYERPFHHMWDQLNKNRGTDGHVADAVRSGAKDASRTALTDVQLAKTNTAQAVFEQDDAVVGYRRVLEGAYSCGLCVVASTRLYHKENLMPCHNRCDCSISPVYDSESPSTILNLGNLEQVHAAIADTFGKDSAAAQTIPGAIFAGKPVNYRDVLVTHDHGEIGPVLGVRKGGGGRAGGNFTPVTKP